jgi:chromate reductase
MLQQPEAYIGHAANLFDEHGAIIDESRREFLQKFLNAFARWIEMTARRPEVAAG